MALQYWTPTRGWWTGHATFLPPDPEAYVTGVNTHPGYRCRITDPDTAQVLAGHATPCTQCDVPHDGHDGSCLLT